MIPLCRLRCWTPLVLCAAVWASAPHGHAQEPAKKPPDASSAAAVRQYRDAVAFQNRGVYDLAADEWQKFLDEHPGDVLATKARHYLGVCRLQLKQYAEAENAFSQVIAQNPKFDLIETTYLNLGLTQYTAAQGGKGRGYEPAVKTFQTLLEKFPATKHAPQALFYLGEAQYALDHKPEAERAYTDILEKYPTAPVRADALYALGVTREELGKQKEAGAAYDLFIKEFPEHALRTEVIMRRGETLYALGKFDTASRWFAVAAASKKFAMADFATLRRAACLYEQKKYLEAAQLYASMPTTYPTSKHLAAATLSAGNCYYLAEDLNAAREWLDKAVKLGGATAVEAGHWLARVLIKQGKVDEALAMVDRILPQAGDTPMATSLLVDRADALYETPGGREKAMALYAEIASKHPDSAVAPQALYLAGFAALETGNHALAHQHAVEFKKRYAAHSLAADVGYVDAEALLQLGQHAEAEKLYAALIAKHPEHPDRAEWQLRRALVLFLEKRYEDTVRLGETLAAELKQPPLVAEAHHLRGIALVELGRVQPGAAALRAAFAADPAWRQADETLLHLAAAERQLGHTAEAMSHLETLVARFQKSKLLDRAHFRLGEMAYASGNYQRAAAEYELVLKNWPASALAAEVMLGLGWTQIAQKDLGTAVETLTKASEKAGEKTEQGPIGLRARYARAVARQQLKQYASAIEDVRAVVAGGPAVPEKLDALYIQALSESGLNRFGEAAATLESILATDPSYAAADKVLYELAWARNSAGNEQEATRIFGRLVAEHPKSPLAAESSFHVGEARYRAGNYAEASRAYQTALEKAASDDLAEKAQHKLGWSKYQAERYEDARQAFVAELARHPRGKLTADASFMVAECLFKQNKHEPALVSFEKLLERPSESKDFQALAFLHATQAAAQLKRWDKALALAERGAKLLPDSALLPELLYEQASAEQNRGKLDAAQGLYRQVAERTQREAGARARFMLGEILFEKKQHTEAVRQFMKVAYGYGYPKAPEAIQRWQANAAYEAARCFEVLNRTKHAKESYREVLEKYPHSDKAPLAKSRLDALGA